MENIYSHFYEIAELAIRQAGDMLRENFMRQQEIKAINGNDIKLKLDDESEKIILNHITSNFSDHVIYSEEIGKVNSESEFEWYIDPMDGTNNYFAGIPYYAISITFLHKRETIFTLIYHPTTNQLFHAMDGGGAFLDNIRLSPSGASEIKRSSISFIRGNETFPDNNLDTLAQKLDDAITAMKPRRIFKMWAPVVDWSLLAFGGIDLVISCYDELPEQFAGAFLAKEAELEVFTIEGKEYSNNERLILATNKILKPIILKALDDVIRDIHL